jgi:AraC-like DNA-binding protein
VASDFRPLQVQLETPRPPDGVDHATLTEALACPVRFSADVSAIEVDAAVLRAPVAGADPVVEAAMSRYIAELCERLPDEATLAGRTGRLLLRELGAGEPTLVEVARRLAITPRTLQRRLRDEGTSFNKVLDAVRCQMAMAQIQGRRASLDEVAFLLGFEKPSSFHRAFKRWTGLTPGEARRRGAVG